MEGQDKLRSFYDKIKSNPSITGLPDDYEVFKSALSDTNKAKGFYDTLKKGGVIQGLPDDFSGFSTILPESAENEKTDSSPVITGFIPGLNQGADGLYQGGLSAVGEIANLGGTQDDYRKALEQLDDLVANEHPVSVDFDQGKALSNYKAREYDRQLEQYRKDRESWCKGFDDRSGWDYVKHVFDYPSRPVSPDDRGTVAAYKYSVGDEVELNRVYKAIGEALREGKGDVGKAKEILQKKAEKEQWGDRVSREAREALSLHKPTEGAAAWVGQMLPQMAGNAAAIAASVSPYTRWLARPLAKANMAALTASSAGSAMADARGYGASSGDVLRAGVLASGLEYFSEKLPFDRYFSGIQNYSRKKLGKAVADKIVNNDAAKHELSGLIKKAGKEFSGRFLSKTGIKNFVGDVAVEGLSEFIAEGGGAMIPMIYQNEADYPTLNEILSQGWEGAKGGVFMGGILGGASNTIGYYANRNRRKEHGRIALADTENGVVEVVGRSGGDCFSVVDAENKVSEISGEDILDYAIVGFDEFDGYAKKQTEENLKKAEESGRRMEYDDSAEVYGKVLSDIPSDKVAVFENVDDVSGYLEQHPEDSELLETFLTAKAQLFGSATNLFSGKANKKEGGIVTARDEEGRSVYVLDETGDGSLVEYEDGSRKFIASGVLQDVKKESIEGYTVRNMNSITPEQSERQVVVGDNVLYNGERARVQRVDDDGTVIEVGGNRVEKVPSGALQFDEGVAQREAQTADPEVVVPETPVADVPADTQPVQIPQTKEGRPDYNAMLESDPELFASEWEKRSTPEATRSALERQSGRIGGEIESLLKNLEKESDFNKIAEREDEIAGLKKQKDNVDRVLAERYAVREEKNVVADHRENSGYPVFSNEEEAVRWVAENSEDVGEILGTYEVVREMKDEGFRNAPRWQQELLGKKIRPESFYENGDRNSVTPVFRSGWLNKNGRGIDELAQELSGYGVEVTNQDVVDFMLGHPSGKVRRNSEEMDVLGQHFSEVASEVSGMKIGRPDSPTGRLFIKKMKTSENAEQLKQQIESAQQAENEVLKSMAEQHESEKQNNNPYRTLADEEIDVVMSQMQEDAVEAPVLELTPENWTNEFGDDGVIDTPIGKVKMGENQYLKFAKLGRDSQLGMVKPTLTNPDVVIEDKSGGVDSERNSSYVYVKTFTDKSGKKHTYFTSVTVLKEGLEVSVSSHIKNKNRVKSLLKEGNLLWNRFGFDSDASGEHQDYTTVTALSPSDNERGTTSQSKLLSESKDMEIPGEKQDFSSTSMEQNPETPSVEEERLPDVDVLFRESEGMNERFNGELQQQIAGTLPKGHVYQLGRPSGVLLSAGIPNLPIELSASKLETKSNSDYESNHPFELSEVENLPDAISNPIAVFDSKTKFGHKVILTELKSNGNNFVVALQINSRPKGFQRNIEVNSIRSVYPKDNVRDIVSWINRGDLLRYVDKNKILNWVTQQRSNSADVAIPNKDSRISPKIQQQSNSAEVTLKDLDVATNILQNFKNPTIEEGEISSSIDELSKELGVRVNKVRSREDLPEGMSRGMKGGKYPGLFDPKSGKVYVVLNEIEDVADAQATVLHEVVGHKGIRGLFGERLPEFCERVLASLPEGKRIKLLEKYEGNRQLAAEEYVAGFAEEYSDPSGWEKVKAIVKEFLRDLTGIDLKLSDNDLKYLLWKAKNGLKEGGMMSAIEGVVRDSRVQDVLFRQQQPDLRIAEEFIKEKRSGLEATKEQFVDSAAAVKELTDFLKNRGIKIRDFEDAYSEALLSDSKSYHAISRYQEQYQQPLNEAIAALGSKGKELRDVYHYLIAKHASERNKEVGNREYEKWLDSKHRDLLAEKKRFEFLKKNGKKDDAEYNKKLKAFEENIARSNQKFEEERAAKEAEFRSRIYAGMSDEDAAVIVRDFEAGCSREEISNLWEKIRAATNFTIERQLKDGLISKESYEAMRETYKYYVPLKGWEETDGVDYSASERYRTPANVSKLVEARGRVSMADNPVAYIEMAAEAAIVEGNRNYVRQCLYNMCVNNPDEGLYSVNRTYYVEKDGEWIAQTEKPAKELFDNGSAKTVLVDKPYKALVSDANAQRYDVTAFVNGEKNTISFAQGSKGLDIADAINRTRMWKPGKVSRAFGHLTRFLSAQSTSRNPEFIVRNFERDFLYAVPAYAIKGGNSIKLIANLRPAFKALHREFIEAGTKGDSELNRYMDEFLNAGGKTGFVHSLDMESRKRKSEREIRRIINRDSAGGRARAVGKAIGSTMEYLSDMSENSIRFAVFLTERQAGKGVKEAAIAAKEITVNFNRKGTVTPAMSQYFAFFNAGVQGSLHNFLGLGLKWGNRFLVANVALGAIQMVAAQLSRCFGDDDELGVSDYDRLSDYTRNNNIVLPDIMRLSEYFGGGNNEEARKYGFMTIPMPQSFRAVSAVGIITDQVLRERKSPSDGVTEIVDNILANMSPLDLETYNFTNGKPWMFFLRALPTAMQPVVDLMTNKNFMGSDVFKEPFTKNMEGMVPQSSLGMKNTNPLLVSISKGLNRWANGTTDINPELQADAATGEVSRNKTMSYVDINPAKVEHIIEGITGGAGKFVNNVFKTASSLVTGGELENRDVPFVRTHRTMPYRQTHWEMFFEARESVADVDFVANTHKKNRNFGIYTKILTNGGQLLSSVSYKYIDELVRGFRKVSAATMTEESKKNWTEIIDRTVLNWAKGQKQMYDEAIKDDDKKKKQ